MCCLLFAMPDAQATLLCGGLHYKPLCRKVNAGLAWCHLMVTREVGISVFPWSKRKFNQVQQRFFFLHQCNRRIVCFRDLQQQWFFFFCGAGGSKRMMNLFLEPLACETALGGSKETGGDGDDGDAKHKGKSQPIQQHGGIECAVSLKAAPAHRLLLVLMLQCSGYSRWNQRGNSRSNDALHHP